MMWRQRLVLLFALLAALLVAAPLASAQTRGTTQTRGPAPADSPLITDLSSHLIAITSNFTGTDLLLFGAIDEPGDILVEIGRAHVCTPVTNAHLSCRLLPEHKKQ